jgi:tRNA(Arg) A34 adenosine deaminase TadA
MSDADFMRIAIAACRRGIEAGQSPFGSAIVDAAGRVISEAHNTVWLDSDPTAHAEVNAIRSASRSLRVIDLGGCTLYTTCEPCPMCLAASHWSKVDRVVFGASIPDATAAGFSELNIPAARMVALGGSRLVVEGGLLRDECAGLFGEWKAAGKSKTY